MRWRFWIWRRQRFMLITRTRTESALKERIIHTGFVVKDQAAMDAFYKDILGFHVYWHGGMRDDETSWVDMQVPNGTDWIEYMLGVPRTIGSSGLGS